MYTLQKDNVVKLTDSEVKRDKYIAAGYNLVVEPVEPTVEPPEEQPADLPNEGAPAETEPTEDNPAEEAPAKGKVKPGDRKNS